MIITPNYIEGAKDSKYAIDPFTKLLDSRIILLFHEINDDMAASIIAQMLLLEAADPVADISLYINSPGGSVTSGFAILDVMNKVRCPISTVAVGSCASMAALLLACGAKGKRYALAHSEIMIHQPLGGYQGQASDISIHAAHILQVKSEINQLLSKATGRSVSEIEHDTDRDNFLSAKSALAYGLIDRIIGI